MAPHPRRAIAAELGYHIWEHLRGLAASRPAEFAAHTRGDVTGWLWEGTFAALIRQAIPGIAEADLRRAREYLNASGMVVNAQAQRGGQPQWFIRDSWHQGPGGHVHVVGASRAAQPPAGRPAPPPPAAAPPPATAPGQRPDIVPALRSLLEQVSDLQSDIDRLRTENLRLRTENERIRSLAREVAGRISQQANDLLNGAGP
jgi:hypothetical protein